MADGKAEPRELDALIVGAGFSGLYMLYRMRDLMGLNVQLYERGDGVGGTWYWNRYPGARCDAESLYYSYSFSEELDQEWVWSSKYPDHAEIKRYLDHVADRFDLHRNITFATCVTEASFDDASNRWHVGTDTGERASAQFLVSAVGCLSSTNVPDIPGLNTFEGQWHHTSRWPLEGVDFAGKRVGQIGTGSTGIQAAPVIAEQAGHLTVFQRTPNFTVPARNAPLTEEEIAEVKANYIEIRRGMRNSAVGYPITAIRRSALDHSEQERNAIFSELWKGGGFKFLWGSFSDLMSSKAANDTAAEFIRDRVRETVKDPAVAEKLLPFDHPYATKRPPLDTNYFETYNRDNVTLVDIRESPIVEITPTGIRTQDKHYELDIIVFATGFDAMTGALLDMNITGTGGLSLRDKWAEGSRTYLGLLIAGFPNLFTITGPGSPSVLVNVVAAAEQHVEWISECVTYMRERGLGRIEPTVDAEEAWVDVVNEAAKKSLYMLANSWYLGANIPGKKRVFMPYVAGLDVYRQRCDEVASKDYEGFELER